MMDAGIFFRRVDVKIVKSWSRCQLSSVRDASLFEWTTRIVTPEARSNEICRNAKLNAGQYVGESL